MSTGSPASPSASIPGAGIVPEWVKRGRAVREANCAAEQLRAARTIDTDEESPRHKTPQATGIVVSLGIHVVILVLFSLVALHATQYGGSENTILGVPGEQGQLLLETRSFELAGGAEAVIVPAVEMPVVEDSPLEVPSLDHLSVAELKAEGVGLLGKDPKQSDGIGKASRDEIPHGGNRVEKGNFAAWTIPSKPRVGENYRIVIEVTLPQNTKRYLLSDLSGTVTGTDGYRVHIPNGSEFNGLGWEPPAHQPAFVRMGQQARLSLAIRGAREALVRDKITVRSDILNEEQELEIVF